MKELESALEVSLFDRMPRGMRPTWYGEIMIRHAKMTLANLATAHDEITALNAGLSGQVAVGCIMPAGISLLPLTVARLKSHYPLLQMRVELDSSDALLAQLSDSKLDIAVARLFEHHDKSAFDFEPLAEEAICVVAKRGHPLTRKRKLKIADLANLSWILPTGKVIRHRFDIVFRSLGIDPPQNVVSTPSLPVTISLLQPCRHVGHGADRGRATVSGTRHGRAGADRVAAEDGCVRNHHPSQSPVVPRRADHAEGAARHRVRDLLKRRIPE